jgi:hypothetical protein
MSTLNYPCGWEPSHAPCKLELFSAITAMWIYYTMTRRRSAWNQPLNPSMRTCYYPWRGRTCS